MKKRFLWSITFVFYEIFSGAGSSKEEEPEGRVRARFDSVYEAQYRRGIRIFMLHRKGEEKPCVIGWINPTEDGKGKREGGLTPEVLDALSHSQRILVLGCDFFKKS